MPDSNDHIKAVVKQACLCCNGETYREGHITICTFKSAEKAYTNLCVEFSKGKAAIVYPILSARLIRSFSRNE